MITRTLNDKCGSAGRCMVYSNGASCSAACIMGIVMAFSIDTMMGFLLAGVTLFILLLASFNP